MKNGTRNVLTFSSGMLLVTILFSVPHSILADTYNNKTYGEGLYNVGAPPPPANPPGQFAPDSQEPSEPTTEPAPDSSQPAPQAPPSSPAATDETAQSDERAQGEGTAEEDGEQTSSQNERKNEGTDGSSGNTDSRAWYDSTQGKALAAGAAAVVGSLGTFALLRNLLGKKL